MPKQSSDFTQSSSQVTGGDPAEGIDPGGTRSTRPGQADKGAPPATDQKLQQRVESGDRNPRTESRGSKPAAP